MSRMRKIIFLLMCVGILAVIYIMFRPKRFTEFYGNNINEIESIFLMNGNNGNVIKLDSNNMETVLDRLDKLKLTRYYTNPAHTGWSYKLQITVNNKLVDVVFYGRVCSVNGKEYKINDSVEQYLDELYKESIKK